MIRMEFIFSIAFCRSPYTGILIGKKCERVLFSIIMCNSAITNHYRAAAAKPTEDYYTRPAAVVDVRELIRSSARYMS